MLVIYSGYPAFFDNTNNYNYFISKNVSVIQLLYHYEDKNILKKNLEKKIIRGSLK